MAKTIMRWIKQNKVNSLGIVLVISMLVSAAIAGGAILRYEMSVVGWTYARSPNTSECYEVHNGDIAGQVDNLYCEGK